MLSSSPPTPVFVQVGFRSVGFHVPDRQAETTAASGAGGGGAAAGAGAGAAAAGAQRRLADLAPWHDCDARSGAHSQASYRLRSRSR